MYSQLKNHHPISHLAALHWCDVVYTRIESVLQRDLCTRAKCCSQAVAGLHSKVYVGIPSREIWGTNIRCCFVEIAVSTINTTHKATVWWNYIYLIRKWKSCATDNYVRSAYFAFFHSIISYGILLLGNCVQVHEILILQKRVIIICLRTLLNIWGDRPITSICFFCYHSFLL